MTFIRFIVLVAVGYAAICSCPKLGQAQQLRRYRPASPTVSPYLNLARSNSGALPNYYALVRPQNLQREINRESLEARRLNATWLDRVDRELQSDRLPHASTGTGSRFMDSGTRFRYLDSSQFYPRVMLRR